MFEHFTLLQAIGPKCVLLVKSARRHLKFVDDGLGGFSLEAHLSKNVNFLSDSQDMGLLFW